MMNPIKLGDPSHHAIIHPIEKSKNRLNLRGIDIPCFPENIILCFFKNFYNIIKEKYSPEIYHYHDDFDIYIFNHNGKRIGFLYPTMGSYASMILEEMISLGAKNIIFIGGVGALLPDIQRGDILLPIKAIRDEGVSYHYEKPGFFNYPSERLLSQIKYSLKKSKTSYREGASWSIASFYRETIPKLNKFIKKGAICVELESASFFSIGKFRNVNVAGLFIAGDNISNKIWLEKKTAIKMPEINKSREKILFLAIDSF